MQFLIQTYNDKIEHDFSFQLLKNIKFLKEWKKQEIKYMFSDSIVKVENTCPVGSVEFVHEFYKLNYNINLKPINVPKSLFKFANRRIANDTFFSKEDIERADLQNVFIKSNDIVKWKHNGYYENKFENFEYILSTKDNINNIQISNYIDIDAEFRCFIYKNKLIDVKRYSGGYDIKFDIDTVHEMIHSYIDIDSPIAYTLDVGVNQYGTFVIEVHNFYSCGLYGFDSYKYADMLWNWFLETKLKAKY